ncbi:MAG: exodeoxyribonuclease VII small subunit [Muribaculaceae bacterium]|nr:exodeoxyribonuclease VII small subunit [Muribaculaceae bacterium]
MEDNNTLTYTQAVNELEEIVKKMQDPECSIDNLSDYTKRSKQLLDFCRKKLTATDEELKRILADLEAQ